MRLKSITRNLAIKFLAMLTLAFSTTVALADFDKTLGFDPVSQDIPQLDKKFPPEFHEVFIPVGDIQLTGFVLTANGKGPHPTAVLLHGLPGNEKNLDLAQSLRRAGFNILFFHYRGSWGSQGNYSFSTVHEDALVAFTFLRNNADKFHVDVNNISIIGHSFGGYAALRSGASDKKLACVVALSAANPFVIANSHRVNSDSENSIGNYVDSLFMLNNITGKQAVEELINGGEAMDTRLYGERLVGKNILLVVGKEDPVTPKELQIDVVQHYKKIAELNVTSHIIAGDHAFSVSRIQLQNLVVKWMLGNCK